MTLRLLLIQRCCSAFTTAPSISRIGRQQLFPSVQSTTTRLFATSNDNDDKKPRSSKKKRGGVPKKFKINENASADDLSAAFAEMARKEGFDDSTAFFADSESFEDDDEENVEAPLDVDDILNDAFDDDDDDDFIDFGDSNDDDMDARIQAAKRDMDLGQVSVPAELDKMATSEDVDLRKLGFKREVNPFGDDETPRREQFKIIANAMECSACGSDFQCKHETKPGFLPAEKFDVQVKLSKIEEIQKLQEKADSKTEWSSEDEVEYLLQTSDGDVNSDHFDELEDIDVDAMADEMGIDLVALSQKKVICKRCHGLQNFGKVDDSLRPGWTEEPAMSQEKFRDLLTPLREKPAVLIALVDLFDFAGSVLGELDAIAGDNPVLFAANKVDLLPSKMGQNRAENWVRRELEYMGVDSALFSGGGAVRLVSCKTGFGIAGLLGKARQLAEEMDCDVYVVGAANAGKSTLLNHILEKNSAREPVWVKKRAGNANARKGALTVSPLPGTTLKFIKMDLGDGRSLYDTPGLLVPGTFTQLLTPEELKVVVPKKEVEPITFRVASGKCVLVGGLAKIEVVGDTKPFLFTFFVANDIKLHPTDSSRSDDFVAKHVGELLSPPLEPKPDWEWEHHDVEIEGAGWKEAAADISLRGLGWVAVTGAGVAKVRISVPVGIGVAVRPPLMPFDVWEVASRYTGGRAVRKVKKTKHGGKRKGVGRR